MKRLDSKTKTGNIIVISKGLILQGLYAHIGYRPYWCVILNLTLVTKNKHGKHTMENSSEQSFRSRQRTWLVVGSKHTKPMKSIFFMLHSSQNFQDIAGTSKRMHPTKMITKPLCCNTPITRLSDIWILIHFFFSISQRYWYTWPLFFNFSLTWTSNPYLTLTSLLGWPFLHSQKQLGYDRSVIRLLLPE